MQTHPLHPAESKRVVAALPFVEALARRVASSMPHSIDLGDLVQDGVLGLIDAAHRFDAARGIKFETFAERRVRGAMIDRLRREAWPRGVRRVRRELEAARESLRRELGYEPSLADLAARVGSDEKRLGRTIVRINTIESTSPLASVDHQNDATLPAVLVPSEPAAPDTAYEENETKDRIRQAISTLPPRERRLINLYYYGDVTMKDIGAELGVNESRVSQLHARAVQRLRQALAASAMPMACDAAVYHPATSVLRPFRRPAAGGEDASGKVVSPSARPDAARPAILAFEVPKVRTIAGCSARPRGGHTMSSRAVRSKSASRNGFASQRQPLSSRKRSASVPATSPVTKMTRRASAGLAAAMAR
jgi:RNA polymerase sigma factor for flagellar operon FliA